ncbi:MAG: hypothetical protein AB1476_04665 [Candidatus Hadarchaeota archaeon]
MGGNRKISAAEAESILGEIKHIKERLEVIEKALQTEHTPAEIWAWYKKDINKINFVDVLE